MMSHNPQVANFLKIDHFGDPYKANDGDTIWWLDDMNRIGPRLFTFDLVEVFNYYGDYPDSLTQKQKELFDREFPELAF